MLWGEWLGFKKEPKKIKKDNEKEVELYARLEQIMKQQGKTKSEAQLEMLEQLFRETNVEKEKQIKEFNRGTDEFRKERNQLLNRVEEKEQERTEAFRLSMIEADKVQNRLLLALDFHRRELKIMSLEKSLPLFVSPEDKTYIYNKITNLSEHNAKIERILQSGTVDVEVIEEIKKRIMNGEVEEELKDWENIKKIDNE